MVTCHINVALPPINHPTTSTSKTKKAATLSYCNEKCGPKTDVIQKTSSGHSQCSFFIGLCLITTSSTPMPPTVPFSWSMVGTFGTAGADLESFLGDDFIGDPGTDVDDKFLLCGEDNNGLCMMKLGCAGVATAVGLVGTLARAIDFDLDAVIVIADDLRKAAVVVSGSFSLTSDFAGLSVSQGSFSSVL